MADSSQQQNFKAQLFSLNRLQSDTRTVTTRNSQEKNSRLKRYHIPTWKSRILSIVDLIVQNYRKCPPKSISGIAKALPTLQVRSSLSNTHSPFPSIMIRIRRRKDGNTTAGISSSDTDTAGGMNSRKQGIAYGAGAFGRPRRKEIEKSNIIKNMVIVMTIVSVIYFMVVYVYSKRMDNDGADSSIGDIIRDRINTNRINLRVQRPSSN